MTGVIVGIVGAGAGAGAGVGWLQETRVDISNRHTRLIVKGFNVILIFISRLQQLSYMSI